MLPNELLLSDLTLWSYPCSLQYNCLSIFIWFSLEVIEVYGRFFSAAWFIVRLTIILWSQTTDIPILACALFQLSEHKLVNQTVWVLVTFCVKISFYYFKIMDMRASAPRGQRYCISQELKLGHQAQILGTELASSARDVHIHNH